jgi:nicotinamide mononucleotide adenylyltransferase
MFDWNKPTTQMLGRFQPWHDGHTALFAKALEKTGQVLIMVREMPIDNDNPFDYEQVWHGIRDGLQAAGYNYTEHYIVWKAPNIVDISYGRDVGYSFTKHNLGETVHNISATDMRDVLRAAGDI